MERNIGELLHAWHEFYLLIGTAAATLMGLMFIAASIAASYFTKEHQAGIQSFFTPTVVHFASVLITCVVLLAPLAVTPLGVLLLAIGAVGLGYASFVWVRMGRRGFTSTIDLADRFWYALSPVAGHLLLIAAAVMLLTLGDGRTLELLAIAMVFLLLAAIRNAWDITAWVVTRSGRS
ncbi:MAG TPA: hypothetical protein VF913_02680 [Xanthobacteraceae bacterium]